MNSDAPVTLRYSTTGTMIGRVVFLGLLLFCVAAGAKTRDLPRFIQCDITAENLFCTKIYKPVCGSDRKMYSNECLLCREMQRLWKILFVIDMSNCLCGGIN